MAKSNKAFSQDTGVDNGGWKDVQDIADARFWKPSEESSALRGILGERRTRDTRFGERASYFLTATDSGTDDDGEYQSGDTLVVWESAGLRGLKECVGKEVLITPTGMRGRVRSYKIRARDIG